ncbi:phosphocholine cytidylyltransferase family protein [Candidatus Levibacter sp. Uisw_134_01]|uniref:phosphocholine cytidylyltransferase family protein n=1 Tax=Candidatus Levibacter sp. Uisw_134_01 TaxID=3230999 RepID=UPI003D4A0001
MRAIILAAGLGKRLRPFTYSNPKCMVPLVGKPLLYRQIRCLRKQGVSNILIVGGYLASKLKVDGVEIIINSKFSETNMVYSLFCAASWIDNDEDIIISYGDIVYEENVLLNLISLDAPIVVSVDKQWQKLWSRRMVDPLSDAETLKLVDKNRIVEIGLKPSNYEEIEGQFMGLIKIQKQNIQKLYKIWHNLNIQHDCKKMFMTEFIQHLINKGFNVRASFTDGGWLEVDSFQDLALYEKMYLDGELKNFIGLN